MSRYVTGVNHVLGYIILGASTATARTGDTPVISPETEGRQVRVEGNKKQELLQVFKK